MIRITPSRTRTRRQLFCALGAALACTLAAPAHAGDYPDHAIHIIVPFSPGGAVDGPIRVIAQEAGKRLGQAFVIENKPGAGATIGSNVVAKSPADGYTLLLASPTNVISATLYTHLPYKPLDDFTAISLLAREEGVIAVNPKVPAHSIQELIAYAKAHPDSLDFASSGNGSSEHLFAAMFTQMAGIKLRHIPYRGSAQATSDVVGGRVSMFVPGLAGTLGLIQSGKLRALAVTGTSRSPQLPNVPTLAESGLPNYSAYIWMGVLAPKGTPAPIIDKLSKAFGEALKTPAVQAYMKKSSTEPVGSTPAEFQQYFRAERDRWATVIKQTGAQIN